MPEQENARDGVAAAQRIIEQLWQEAIHRGWASLTQPQAKVLRQFMPVRRIQQFYDARNLRYLHIALNEMPSFIDDFEQSVAKAVAAKLTK